MLAEYPGNIYLLKVSNRDTREVYWIMYKENNKDLRRKPLTFLKLLLFTFGNLFLSFTFNKLLRFDSAITPSLASNVLFHDYYLRKPFINEIPHDSYFWS